MDTVNPIAEISKSPPQFGVNIRGPPTGLGQNRPPWFASAPISFGSELDPSPELSTDYASGFPTNESNNLPKIVRCFRDDLMTTNQIGQLVVTRKEKKNRYPAQSRLISYSILNVPAWNHLQASIYKIPDCWEDTKSAQEFFKDWYVEGIVAFEKGEKGKFYDESSQDDRILNVTVRGHAFTFKGWTGELTVGTKLFLVLKKADLPQKYHCRLKNGINSNVKPRPFVLSFWADKDYDRPPQSELEYLDEFGFRQRGKAIQVGSVLKTRGSMFDDSRMVNLHTHFEALLNRPKIEIIVDPDA